MNAGLAEMFRYDHWANLRLLEACRAFTTAQLDAQPPGISGTVAELLMHIVGGEATFVLRTMGRQHEGEINRQSEWPGLDGLIAIANRAGEELIAIAERFDADSLVDLPWRGKLYAYPRSFFLVHAMEHGIEHRTEVKVGLAQLGVATPDLDAWEYAAARGYGTEHDAPART
ncbi:MAG: DinB family protein [Tepidiformaceae bacterium]